MAQEEEIHSHSHIISESLGDQVFGKLKGVGRNELTIYFFIIVIVHDSISSLASFEHLWASMDVKAEAEVVRRQPAVRSPVFVLNLRLGETLSGFLGHDVQARERPRAKHSTQLAS